MEMDTDLDVWTPIWWYNPGQHDRTKQLLSEYESLQTMPSWKRAMMENKPVIIADTGTVQEDCPEEYLFTNGSMPILCWQLRLRQTLWAFWQYAILPATPTGQAW